MTGRFDKLRQVLQHRQFDMSIMLDNVTKFMNIGAIVRTADAAGVANVHAVHGKVEGWGRLVKTAKGSEKWLDIHQHASAAEAFEVIRGQNKQQIVTGHLDGKDFREIDYTVPTCFVVGAEGGGVSEWVQENSCHLVKIPMFGMVQSLNVGVSAGILLYEAQRQRSMKSMYGTSQVKDDEFERFAFKLLYRNLAKHCDKNGFRYPKLDENGLIADEEWDEQRIEGTVQSM